MIRTVFYGVLCSASLFLADLGISKSLEDAFVDGPSVLKIEGSRLIAKSLQFTPENVKRIVDLASSREVKEIELSHIPGGAAWGLGQVQKSFRGKRVIISGPCASACALSILYAGTIVFDHSRASETRPLLFFHGAFKVEENGKLTHFAESVPIFERMIIQRFPSLDPEFIRKALSFTSPDHGLVIEHDLDRYHFSICTPWPTSCEKFDSFKANYL